MKQIISDTNKRLTKNTIFLYVRMFLVMGVALYTSRIVLDSLGEMDFGIYNIVGGVIGMFGFLNSSMTASTQRFLIFELGRNNQKGVKRIFSLSLQTHAIISLILVLIAETIGLWFLYNKLIIPQDRFEAALWVYQCAVVSTVILIMSVPYNALIIAHEKMSAFAYISILEVLLKLGVVFFLYHWEGDKLVIYAILLLIVQGVVRLIYGIYCRRNFKAYKYSFVKDGQGMKELFFFAGWNLMGNFAGISFVQGTNIILNVFLGPLINAARGISLQVTNALNQFSINLQMALNPQITKSYAANNLDYMRKLICVSSKYTGYLLFIVCFPVCLEIDYILKLWLGDNIPEYTSSFIILSVIATGIDSISNSVMVAANATGRIKKYQMITSLCLLSMLPLGYLVLFCGGSPISVMILSIIVAFITMIVRVILVNSMIGLSVFEYLRESVLKLMLVASVAIIIPSYWRYCLNQTFCSFVLVVILSLCSSVFFIYVLGLNHLERNMIKKYIENFQKK